MDRQVVIETHSEHMVNRARILVAEKRLHPKHVQILLVNRNRKGSFIYPIPILENGEFGAEWPKEFAFFDERYNDTMLLMKLKGQGGSAKYGSRIGHGIP
jgi:predicted ATPase